MATALCADRAVAAAPARRAESTPASTGVAGGVAGQFVRRLTVGLGRAVSQVRLVQSRREGRGEVASVPLMARTVSPPVVRWTGSPFEFRLPPPTV